MIKKRPVLFTCMLVVVLVMSSVSRAVEKTENIARLKELGRACLVYMKDNGEKMPPSLSTLYYEGYINDVNSFASPANPAGVLERVKIDERSDYVLSYQAHLAGNGSESMGTAKGLLTSGAAVTLPNISAPLIDPSGPPQAIIQDRLAVNNGGNEIYVFYSDGTIRLKSGEVVSGERQTIERPKQEQPKADRQFMERPEKEKPMMERPTSEKSVMERSTDEIPVAERPKPEKPVPDRQSFDDYQKEQFDTYEKWLEQQKGSQ